MILEDLMLDLMYYLPSYKKVREFQVTKDMVLSQKSVLQYWKRPAKLPLSLGQLAGPGAGRGSALGKNADFEGKSDTSVCR